MKHPDCTEPPEKCVIRNEGGEATCLAWGVAYDGNGNPIMQTQDPNTYTTFFRCFACGRSWRRNRKGDKEWIG